MREAILTNDIDSSSGRIRQELGRIKSAKKDPVCIYMNDETWLMFEKNDREYKYINSPQWEHPGNVYVRKLMGIDVEIDGDLLTNTVLIASVPFKGTAYKSERI
jgi:hypothetical protein